MRRVSYSLILIVILILVSSCRVGIKTTTDINYQQQLLAATLFQQCAAEMKALSYQAYNIAGMRLEEALKEANDPHHLAVILDLDETVLDNSPHSGQSIIDRFSFPIGWDEWCYKAEDNHIFNVCFFTHW
jgi:5'-nucleotidase (lipoprotein e(P4) family)